MALERVTVTPFQVEEIGSGLRQQPREGVPTRPRAARTRGARGARGVRAGYNRGDKKRQWKVPASLAVKVGVCVAACALMLGLKELDAPVAAQMVNGVRGAVNEETDLSEMLGKLQFVELPDALEVFSGNNKMAIPVSAPQMQLEEEAQYVMWKGAPHAEVVATASGQVRAIGEDSILGRYVRLQHADDVETIYYGLSAVNVEEGQPIRRNDTLGTLGEDGMLRLHVLLAGKPQPPEQYLDLVNAG